MYARHEHMSLALRLLPTLITWDLLEEEVSITHDDDDDGAHAFVYEGVDFSVYIFLR